MEIARLQVRIDQLVRGMLDEGLLHDQFLKSQELQAAGYTPLVGIMIHQYCTEMENYLTEFANSLYFPIWIQPKVDYTKMSGRAFGLQLCSFNAGVRCIGHACSLLFQACTRRSKEQCVEVLYKLYREYSRLRTKFMAVLQLEVQIFRLRKDS